MPVTRPWLLDRAMLTEVHIATATPTCNVGLYGLTILYRTPAVAVPQVCRCLRQLLRDDAGHRGVLGRGSRTPLRGVRDVSDATNRRPRLLLSHTTQPLHRAVSTDEHVAHATRTRNVHLRAPTV
jgi:hypothetical protein